MFDTGGKYGRELSNHDNWSAKLLTDMNTSACCSRDAPYTKRAGLRNVEMIDVACCLLA